MKRTFFKSLLACLLVLASLLCACGDRDALVYEKERNAYVREGDGAVFFAAPQNYRAVKIDKSEQIGEIEQTEGDDLPLYAIYDYAEKNGMDPAIWMADAEYRVYVAEGTTLPKLWDMQPAKAQIVENATISYSVGTVDQPETVQKLLSCYRDGFSVAYTDARCTFRLNDAERNELAFDSKTYGGLYYVLQIYRFEESIEMTEEVTDPAGFTPAYEFDYAYETHNGRTYVRYDLGKSFLYDRATGLCYPIGGLLDSYFD